MESRAESMGEEERYSASYSSSKLLQRRKEEAQMVNGLINTADIQLVWSEGRASEGGSHRDLGLLHRLVLS